MVAQLLRKLGQYVYSSTSPYSLHRQHRQRQMYSIGFGIPKQRKFSQVSSGQLSGFVCDPQHLKLTCRFDTTICRIWIALPHLVNYKLRDEDFVSRQLLVPPLVRSLLVPTDNYVCGRPRDKLADDGCFEIDCRFHRAFTPPESHTPSSSATASSARRRVVWPPRSDCH